MYKFFWKLHVKVSRTALDLNHLMFADKLLLLCSSSTNEIECMANCVKKYSS